MPSLRTETWRRGSGNGDFFVGAEDGAQGFADFAEGGVGLHRIINERHQIFRTLRGLAQSVEAALHSGAGTLGTQLTEPGGLAVPYGFINLQNLQRFLLCDIVIHADDDFFLFVYGHLVTIAGFRDFALRVTLLDGGDHAAHRIDPPDIVPGSFFNFIREG